MGPHIVLEAMDAAGYKLTMVLVFDARTVATVWHQEWFPYWGESSCPCGEKCIKNVEPGKLCCLGWNAEIYLICSLHCCISSRCPTCSLNKYEHRVIFFLDVAGVCNRTFFRRWSVQAIKDRGRKWVNDKLSLCLLKWCHSYKHRNRYYLVPHFRNENGKAPG